MYVCITKGSCIVNHYTLSSKMCQYQYFLNFLTCVPELWTSHQSMCWADTTSASSTEKRGDNKCWVRAVCVFLMGADAFSERLLRAECDLVEMEKPVTGNKMFLLPPAIVQGLQFCFGTEQCCFFLSFLIC